MKNKNPPPLSSNYYKLNTNSMRLSITQYPNTRFTIEVDDSMQLADLQALLELECNISKTNQRLQFNNRVIADTESKKTLKDLGMHHESMLYISDKTQQPTRSVNGSTSTSDHDVEKHRKLLLNDPQLMSRMTQMYPEIADAARNNPLEFGRLLRKMQADTQRERDQYSQEMQRLNSDPYNIDNQRRIEEMIQQENISRNMATALELNPESFASVTMLFLDVTVNNTPIQALVDSGAQSTVMSRSCAERCGIMRLVDKRFAGEARGVGRAKILGRVHNAQMKVGSLVLMCSFNVMEGAHLGLLFGLDMLRRHQMCIDLRKNALIIGEENIEFLPEHRIAKQTQDDDDPGAISTPAAGPAPPLLGGGSANPTSSQRQISASRNYPEAVVKSLMALGVSREEAIRNLDAAGGNPDAAASLIFS